MEWSDDFKIGLSVVDAQHKRLFGLFAELDEALAGNVEIDVVKETLVTLEQYKTRHFQMEEKYMAECSYPKIGEQKEAHYFFTERLAELEAMLKEKGVSAAFVESVRNEIGEWLKAHVLGLDLEFGKYYQEYTQKQNTL